MECKSFFLESVPGRPEQFGFFRSPRSHGVELAVRSKAFEEEGVAQGTFGKSNVQVPKAGLEPAQLAPHAPETCVSTNFTTSA